MAAAAARPWSLSRCCVVHIRFRSQRLIEHHREAARAPRQRRRENVSRTLAAPNWRRRGPEPAKRGPKPERGARDVNWFCGAGGEARRQERREHGLPRAARACHFASPSDPGRRGRRSIADRRAATPEERRPQRPSFPDVVGRGAPNFGARRARGARRRRRGARQGGRLLPRGVRPRRLRRAPAAAALAPPLFSPHRSRTSYSFARSRAASPGSSAPTSSRS